MIYYTTSHTIYTYIYIYIYVYIYIYIYIHIFKALLTFGGRQDAQYAVDEYHLGDNIL